MLQGPLHLQRYRGEMPEISSTTLRNGLPLHRVHLDGTRATTVLVAFDAGARTERPEENGMAHFLEHLVFKGGEKYATYRDVNNTAERLGAQLNAYTSHDLVAFHITCRGEALGDAVDGHDLGSGQMNLFVDTTDPVPTFEDVRRVLASTARWPDARAAFRDADGDVWTVLWPAGHDHFAVT